MRVSNCENGLVRVVEASLLDDYKILPWRAKTSSTQADVFNAQDRRALRLTCRSVAKHIEEPFEDQKARIIQRFAHASGCEGPISSRQLQQAEMLVDRNNQEGTKPCDLFVSLLELEKKDDPPNASGASLSRQDHRQSALRLSNGA